MKYNMVWVFCEDVETFGWTEKYKRVANVPLFTYYYYY